MKCLNFFIMKKLDKAAKIATIIVAILSFLTFIINYLLWW